MASIIKADNIQKVSDGSNIIKKCGSTITLGSCGATIALACGASQTGFGRTGTVDWCTTAKTSPFTGVSGKGYFVNTSCGAVTVTLPATPTAGDIISIADYASTFQTNNLTICKNSSKINGSCNNATLNTKGQSITLVYVDGTRGWKNTMDSTSDVSGAPTYITATGGTITTCGDYKIHTFTSDGCFSISAAPTPANNTVDYLVVAGGGGASGTDGNSPGGGGAGGYREAKTGNNGCYTASPLATPIGIPVTTTTYPITVGAGGAGIVPTTNASAGSPSTFSSITSAGGGYGAGAQPPWCGGAGGSGGGAAGGGLNRPGGAGNTPPTSPPQGQNGGNSPAGPTGDHQGGGGGGAGAVGQTATPSIGGGDGGIGVGTAIAPTQGTPGPTPGIKYFSGGGGGGWYSVTAPGGAGGTGGAGGGGPAGNPPSSTPSAGVPGTANTGGGAGGANAVGAGGSGGSGIVIIRYKYQ